MGERTETVARAICAAMGEDPDGHDIMRVCNADNSPAPLWRFYEEHADAAIAALSDHVSAPDLLEALEPIVEFFVKARAGFTDGWEERMGPEHVVFGWNGEDLKLGDLQRARAAIARAQGKG